MNIAMNETLCGVDLMSTAQQSAPETDGRKKGSDPQVMSGRLYEILNKSAQLFAEKGVDGTTMRDIAAATGIRTASLYYYFKSKEDLFLAAHGAGVETVCTLVKDRIRDVKDPWERLEIAAATHARALFASDELSIVFVPNLSASKANNAPELVRQRDRYEELIREIVDDLPLAADIDRTVFRLQFLGALNWMQTWYRAGSGLPAEEVGRHMVRIMRNSC